MARAEFIALIAMMFATVAFSMDAMLPALPDIAAELSPDDVSRAPLVLSAFFFGLGLGTFLAGPLSDAFGRRSVMIAGSCMYIAASALAWASATMELMLIARVFQGLGAAGPRVVAMAVTRDLFSGRDMARIVSFVMMVFALVPGFAPALGMFIISAAEWRGIFVAFMIFSAITVVWLILRLPETLPPAGRRPLQMRMLMDAAREVFAHPIVRLSIIVQTLAMAMLISMLLLIQQIYADVYGRADTFVYWFGAAALVSASASWLNAALVVRIGMRRLVTTALGVQIVLCTFIGTFHMTELAEPLGFTVFLIWQISMFLQAGLTLGNLAAIGMEPMGHIAGMASSIMGGGSTVVAALLASPVVLFFDGTLIPLITFTMIAALIGFLLMLHMARVEVSNPAE